MGPDAHLQEIHCSRHQLPVLKAKYHPAKNNIYCRRGEILDQVFATHPGLHT